LILNRLEISRNRPSLPPHTGFLNRPRLLSGGQQKKSVGPNDTPARCYQIMATLQRSGTGDAGIFMPVAPEQLDALEIDDEEDDDSLPDMRWGRR
jgi:hypothetical protein